MKCEDEETFASAVNKSRNSDDDGAKKSNKQEILSLLFFADGQQIEIKCDQAWKAKFQKLLEQKSNNLAECKVKALFSRLQRTNNTKKSYCSMFIFRFQCQKWAGRRRWMQKTC